MVYGCSLVGTIDRNGIDELWTMGPACCDQSGPGVLWCPWHGVHERGLDGPNDHMSISVTSAPHRRKL